MKSKTTIILSSIGILLIIIGLIFMISNKKLAKNKIEIIDATFNCITSPEKFYEDDKYEYYFPCVKSNSIYVKFPNGNKMLVKQALEEKKVTINELIKAGLEVNTKEK